MKSPRNRLLDGDCCPICNGRCRMVTDGRQGQLIMIDCPACNGLGIVNIKNACPDCKGTGLVEDDKFDVNCETCHGTGLASPQATPQ